MADPTKHFGEPAGPDRTLAFLSDPASYEHRPETVKIVQTHISFVALAGPLVFKVKKPVDFGFVDFTTPERRRHFCHREVELNRRLCSDVYLGVVPIVHRKGRLAFAGEATDEPIVDYAVKMRRLDDERFLSARLAAGTADNDDLERVAAHLLPFYTGQKSSSEIRSGGRLERIRELVAGNLDACAPSVGDLFPKPTYDALRYHVDTFLDRRADLLRRRVTDGWIKDCHGDLRPQHIHLGERCTCIYDCIEFNDHFRYVDVAADVAFLSMELAFAGRWDLSRHFADRMARSLDDPDMPGLLDFYQSYRAAVRAKVAALTAAEPEVGEQERRKSRDSARDFFRLALRFALFGSEPILLAVMGRIGTGKTTVASALGDALGWPVRSSDPVRKELAGLPAHERPPDDVRERLYTTAMSQKTYDRLMTLAEQDLPRAQGAILDATFGRQRYRDQVAETARRAIARCFFVEVTAATDVIKQRLAEREHSTGVVSDARLEDFDELGPRYTPPEEIPPERLIRVDGSQPLDPLLAAIYTQLIDRKVPYTASS